MSNTYTQFQILRGDSASNVAYVGRPGELTADMENNILRLHDGTTPGGTIIGSGSGGGGGGATFPYTGNAVITGSLWVSGSYNGFSGITGSLLGTASYAETTITASYISGGIYIPEGLIITGSTYITGTLEVTNGITGSLLGTSSWATSSSFAISSSYTLSASNAISSSYALTASRAISSSRADSSAQIDVLSGGSTTGLGIYSGSFYGTASQAITASYALNAGSGGGSGFPFSGSAVITGSLLISSSGLYLSGSGVTGSLLGTASNAISSSYALTASRAISSSRADSSEKVDVLSGGSTTGLGIYSGSFFGTSSWAVSASYAANSGQGVGFPFSGSAVITGSLLISSSGIYLSGSGLTGSVLGTSSWANNSISASHATFAISSSRSISTEKVDVLSGGSTTGLGIYSGSFFGTSSWALNAVNAGAGSGFPFSGSAVITGSLLISSSGIYLSGSGLTGSVLGTSSWASNSVSSSRSISTEKVDVISGGSTTGLGVYSGSFFGTSSWAVSASYAVNSGQGVGFPFSGSAVITGSLLISSSGLYLSGSGVTGSLLGTASNAVSASYAVTASHAITAVSSSYALTASRAISASRADSSEKVDVLSGGSTTGLGVYSGSFSGSFFGNVTSASYATTASYALNGGSGGVTINSNVDNYLVTATGTANTLQGESGLRYNGSIFEVGYSSSIGEDAIQIGNGRTGNGYAYIDFVGDTTYTDYALRIIRNNTGANATSEIIHKGTGTLGIGTADAASLQLNTSNTARLFISSSGNVGIGTTNPATTLDVNGSIAVGGYTRMSGSATYTMLWRPDGGVAMYLGGSDQANYYDNQAHYFRDRSSNTTMFINANTGNVGIGTTSPNTRLQVSSNIQGGSPSAAGTATTSSAYFTNSDPAYGILMGVLNAGHGWIQAQRTDTIATTYNLLLNPNGGNIGVGTTTPGSKFHVFGGDILRTNSDYVNGSAGSGFVITHVASSGNTDAQLYAFRGGNTSYGNIVIPGGSVGIGTTSPEYALDVNGGIRGDSWIGRSNIATPTADAALFRPADNSIALSTANTERVRINSSGNVGIGTTSPNSKLDVRGILTVGSGVAVNDAGATNYISVSTTTIGQSTGIEFFTNDGTYNPRAWIVHTNSAGSQLLTFNSTYSSGTGYANFSFLNGNVGIGTTLPTSSLHVIGTITAGTTNTSGRINFGTGDTGVAIYRDNTYDLVIQQHESSANPLYMVGAGDVRVSIDSNDNQTDSKFVVGNNNIKSTNELFSVNEAGNGYFSGSVGIGVTSPSTKLHVYGDPARITIQSSTRSWFIGTDNSPAGFYFPYDNTAGASRMFIDTSGNVGIGTTSPSNKLHIQGNVSASSYTSSISNAVGYFGTASWAVSASRGVTTEKVDVLSGGSTTGLGTYSGSFYGTSMVVSGGQAYTVRYDVGNQATTYTVNWNNGNHQSVNLTANTQLSFSNGQPGGAYSLELRPTGTYSASWPSSVKWPSNSEPTQTKSSTKKDIFTFYYDGTVYNGQVFGFDYALS